MGYQQITCNQCQYCIPDPQPIFHESFFYKIKARQPAKYTKTCYFMKHLTTFTDNWIKEVFADVCVNMKKAGSDFPALYQCNPFLLILSIGNHHIREIH
jgi:hypothetical protein